MSNYLAIQETGNSWNHVSAWGDNSIENAHTFIGMLRKEGVIKSSHRFVDFGGNDGTTANAWRIATGNEVYSVDLSAAKQRRGAELYPDVNFVNCRLESIKLPDGHGEWGYSSHTLEHVEDLAATMSEIMRVVTRSLFVVVPIETAAEAAEFNPAHMRASESPNTWRDWLTTKDSIVSSWGKSLYGNEFVFVCNHRRDEP